jgi:hypothetical protein
MRGGQLFVFAASHADGFYVWRLCGCLYLSPIRKALPMMRTSMSAVLVQNDA